MKFDQFKKQILSFVEKEELIIYEDLISLFIQRGAIFTWEFLKIIVEIASRTPDSESFLFSKSSSILKRDFSLDDNDFSPEQENSIMQHLSKPPESQLDISEFKKNSKSQILQENINLSNLENESKRLFKEEDFPDGNNRFFLNIPGKKKNGKSLKNIKTNRSRFYSEQRSHLSGTKLDQSRYLNKSHYSNNQEDELIRKCILNLLKFAIEDGLNLREEVIRFSFDAKKISIGKFYFLVLHKLRINHHYSLDVLVN